MVHGMNYAKPFSTRTEAEAYANKNGFSVSFVSKHMAPAYGLKECGFYYFGYDHNPARLTAAQWN